PGLREWAVLGRSWYLASERLPDGSPRFDTVLLDAPATGHALDMLAVPKVILDVAPLGVLRRDAERAWEMLQDPEQSGGVVVTLPEELPAAATLELVSKLREAFELPRAGLVANGRIAPMLSDAEAAAPVERSDVIGSTTRPSLAEVAARRAVPKRVLAENLRRLDALHVARVLLAFWWD